MFCRRIQQIVFYLLLFLLTAIQLDLRAQTAGVRPVISGKVINAYGYPLKGVNVRIKGGHGRSISDQQGVFTIEASASEVLEFSFPGYNIETVKPKAHKKLTIKLYQTFLPFLDSVRTGTDSLDSFEQRMFPFAYPVPGIYDEERSFTSLGAVSTIYTNQLTTTPASLYAYALPGRLAGLKADQVSGWRTNLDDESITTPGLLFSSPTSNGVVSTTDNTEIGLSLRGQSPLTIVDGVQRNIYALDPETIASISVQKDAMSTILLGQQSSRGAIVIKTRRPEAGPPHISFTAQNGWQSPLGLPKALPSYQYAYMMNEALANVGQDPRYTAADIQAYRDGSDPTGHPNVDWQRQILDKSSLLTRYSLNVSGGSERARYIVGLNYMDQQGMFKEGAPNTYSTKLELKRYEVNTKIDVDVTKEFNLSLQIFGRIEDATQPGAGYSEILSKMFTTPNNAYPVYNPDGSFGGTNTYTTNLYSLLGNSGVILNNNKDLMANVDMTYKLDRFVKGFWFKGKANVSVLTATAINRSENALVYKMNVDNGDTTYAKYGSLLDQQNNFSINSSGQYWFYQGALGFTRAYGKNNLDAEALFDQQQTIFNFDLPSKYTNFSTKLKYDYDRKYLFEAAVNEGGYNRFSPGHQFGLFYAGAVGWNMAEEKFIKENFPWINQFKWRVDYGHTGNANVGYFVWRPSFNTTSGVYTFGNSGTGANGVIESPLINADATWEKANKLNMGADISLFGNKLQLTADVYTDKYYDLMWQQYQPAIIGNTYPSENIGSIRYFGTEFSATYQNHLGGFNYFVTANASFSGNKIIDIRELKQPYPWTKRTGHSTSAIYGYIAEGFIETQQEAEAQANMSGYTVQPGDIKLKDINNDHVIDQFDQVNLSGDKPIFFYGLTTGFSYKGFNISVLVQGVGNRQIVLNDARYIEFSGYPGQGQLYKQHLGRWTPETSATATFPRLTNFGLNINNDATSTFWLHSGNYMRIKNVDVGYVLPYRWTSRLRLADVRIFVNGQNLITFFGVDGVDPESYGSGYPTQRVINTGITIKL